MDFKIDNCKYCACITTFNATSIPQALRMIEDGEIHCWNCEEAGEPHNDFNVYVKNICNGIWEIIFEGNKLRTSEVVRG